MANYFGYCGSIQLQRRSDRIPVPFELLQDDVNAGVNRFSVSKARSFITGDRLRIQTNDGSPLELIADNGEGPDSPEITAYVNVNAVGGLRLYRVFEQAMEDQKALAYVVQDISADKTVLISLENGEDYFCCGDVRDYQITTRRENLDTTALSDQYREQYEHGLIAGQGRFTVYFPELLRLCNTNPSRSETSSEYFARLVMRLTYGSDFSAQFVLHQDDDNERSLWYECEKCVINNVSVTVEPKELLVADIDFVTSGEFVLRIGQMPSFLQQEDEYFILQENLGKVQLTEPD